MEVLKMTSEQLNDDAFRAAVNRNDVKAALDRASEIREDPEASIGHKLIAEALPKSVKRIAQFASEA